MKLVALALLTSVALIVPASAQTAPSAAPAAQTAQPAKAHSGQWRASKLIGLDIYNDQNEKLGDISEVLLDHSGKVTGLVIGVGGFLGMGQRDIMVDMAKLKFVNEAPKQASTTGATTTTGTAGTQPRATRSADEQWYPDHAILSGATKDSVKNMPEFKYN